MQLAKWSIIALIGMLCVYLVLQFGTRLLAKLPLLALAFQWILIAWTLEPSALPVLTRIAPSGGLGLLLLCCSR